MDGDGERTSWLQEHAIEWVRAGLISDAQAEAILHLERADAATSPPRLTVVAEVASYLGSLIAVAGGAAIIGPNWEGLGLFGQVAVALAIATIGFAVGTWFIRQCESGAERLGGFLWVIGTGGVALAVASVINDIEPVDDEWFPATVGLAVTAIGAALWRNLDRPLQLLTTAAGIALAAGGFAGLADLSFWVIAPGFWAPSLLFGVVAATHRARPRLAALATSATGMMIASFLFMNESERFGAVAAVISATVIVSYALFDRSWPLVAVGLIAFFIAITALMATVLESMVARLVAVALGLVVVAAVAVRAQRTGHAAARARITGFGPKEWR